MEPKGIQNSSRRLLKKPWLPLTVGLKQTPGKRLSKGGFSVVLQRHTQGHLCFVIMTVFEVKQSQ